MSKNTYTYMLYVEILDSKEMVATLRYQSVRHTDHRKGGGSKKQDQQSKN